MRILNRDLTLKTRVTKGFDLRLIIVLITYVILGIIFFRYYQYQINNDGISYISIAKLYYSGNLNGAINDYWGPLISWLMIPFLFFAKTPLAVLQTSKVLTLIVGFITIIGIKQLSYRFEMDEVVRTVLLFIMVPVVLYFALSVLSPDLLMVCVLVYYLAIIFNLDYPNKLSYGVLCGILGAVAYLTKSYGFTFFIATFIILNLFHYFRDSDRLYRKKVLKNFLIGFAVFLIISGVWIALISNKDQKLTFGSAGAFNYDKFGPQSQGNSDQITANLQKNQWSPFSSWSNFKYQIKLIYKNSLNIGKILYNFSYLALLILLAYIVMCIQPPRKLISQNMVLYLLVTLLILCGGYLLIVVEQRYIWLIDVLLILMGGYLINLLFKTDFFTKERFAKVRKTAVLLIFAILFISMPVNYLIHNVNTDKSSYTLSNTLMNQYGVHDKLATINAHKSRLTDMNFLVYYMDTSFKELSQNDISTPELRNELKNNITYYFVWDNSVNSSYLVGYKDITNGTINSLKVYTLNS